MVRLTLSHRAKAVQTGSWKRTLVAVIACATTLWASSTLAVSRSQLDNTQAQIQNINQSIKSEESRIATLEKEIWSLDRQILETRKVVREERLAGRKQVFDARRELKMQEIEIERIQKDIALVDFDVDIVNRDITRDKQRFAELNVLKQSLEENEFRKRQIEYQRQLSALDEKKAPLLAELETAKQRRASLQEQMTSMESDVDDATLDKDNRLSTLLQKRDRANGEMASLRTQLRADRNKLAQLQDQYGKLSAQFKREQAVAQQARQAAVAKQPVAAAPTPAPAPAASAADVKLDRTDYNSYVFVISGDQEPDIEQTLHLKNWVESYGAKYIQASWNGFNNGNGPKSTAGFREAFRSYIRQIPKDAKLVLIGHGLGGGAAIEAATVVAFNEGRTIDFLAALDPIGDRNLRANIVYKTDGACSRPDKSDEMTNSDYVLCIKSAKKRLITSNIKQFYNRWQKDAQGPLDYQREIPSLTSEGKVVNVPTATGRFETAENTSADQKRLFFSGDKNAHRLLLAEEAKQLPKLLVQHLR